MGAPARKRRGPPQPVKRGGRWRRRAGPVCEVCTRHHWPWQTCWSGPLDSRRNLTVVKAEREQEKLRREQEALERAERDRVAALEQAELDRVAAEEQARVEAARLAARLAAAERDAKLPLQVTWREPPEGLREWRHPR